VEQACDHLRAQRGLHFDPRLVDLFLALIPQAEEIMNKWAERD
jgi:putative two-component system response regulator